MRAKNWVKGFILTSLIILLGVFELTYNMLLRTQRLADSDLHKY